ncbi:MAG: HEAT repeat protein [Myxococcota bacterium]
MGWLAYYFIDNIFYARASHLYPSADELSGFIGLFYAASAGLTLAAGLLFTGPILRRLGVGKTITVLPTSILLTTAALAAVGFSGGAAPALLLAAGAAQLSFAVFWNVTDIPATNLLYQPMRPSRRARVQALSEGIVYPVAGGIAGVALLLLNGPAGATVATLAVLTAVLAGGWLAAARFIGVEYPKQLERALSRPILSEVALDRVDAAAVGVLVRGLDSGNPRLVAYCLDVLADAHYDHLERDLVRLAGEGSPTIRVLALSHLERRPTPRARTTIRRTLSQAAEVPLRAAALRALCALEADEAMEEVEPFLASPDEELRFAGFVGLLRYGGLGAVVAVGQRVLALADGPDARGRGLAARVIGALETASFYRPLISLLEDEEASVRSAALEAARRVREPRLLASVVPCLADPATRSLAVAALEATPIAVVVSVQRALEGTESYAPDDLRRLLRVCACAPAERVHRALGPHLGSASAQARGDLLQTLSRLGFAPTTDEGRRRVELALLATTQRSVCLLRAKVGARSTAGADQLCAALDGDLAALRHQVFLLVSFLYREAGLLHAEGPLVDGDSSAKALAYESLEVSLESRHRSVLLLVDPTLGDDRRLDQLSALNPSQGARTQCASSLADDPDTTPWTRACAIDVWRRTASGADLSPGLAGLGSPEPRVREAALHALSELDPQGARQAAARLRDDPDPTVAALSQSIREEGTRPMLSFEKVAILKGTEVFAETPDHVLASVAGIAEVIELPAGETFIHRGAFESEMYIVIDGTARVHLDDRDLADLGPGEMVGEMQVLDPAPRSASVSARSELRLFRIHRAAFEAVMADRPEIARGVTRVLVRRLRKVMAT